MGGVDGSLNVNCDQLPCGAMRLRLQVAAGLLASSMLPAQESYAPLFNGRDLTGWVNINCAPDTFTVRDPPSLASRATARQAGMIHTTGKPICEIRTERMYENFVLEVEWQHVKPGGNAGVFVWADALPARGQPFLRAVEVQVLDGSNSETHTSHGDVFAIHGAKLTPDRPHPRGWMRSLPSERRARPAGEWNHYRITCANGTIKLAVNGKEVSGGYDISPRKGYIALEAEGSPALFRNIRIRELPAGDPVRADQIAQADQGFVSLYTGLDLTGWQPSPAGVWVADDWIIKHEGGGGEKPSLLVSQREYADFELMVDWRLPKTSLVERTSVNVPRSAPNRVRALVQPTAGRDMPAGEWHRTIVRVAGDRVTTTIDGRTVIEDEKQSGLLPRGSIALGADGACEFANVFIRELERPR
jgi:hypothetical protein